jgi:hypothetical protein
MSKFGKALKAFGLILAKPALLNLVLDYEENFKKTAIKKYQVSKGLRRIHLDIFLKEVNYVDAISFLEGGSIVTDYLLLAALSKKMIDPVCFEIGTWRGESTVQLSRFAKHVYTLNLSPDELKRSGLNDFYANMQGELCKNVENITQLWGNSHKFDFRNYNRSCDIVFIDGDHHYKSVLNDTIIAFNLLRNDKSIIVWHDYGNGTETVRWEVLLGILDGTPENKRRHLYSVNNTLCAIYYPYPVDSFTAEFPQKATKLYKVIIEEQV